MIHFFENLDPVLKIFWYTALPVSIIFLIQTIMTFMGTDGGDGMSADFDSDLDGADAPFQLLSFRSLIHFLLGFSWSGISLFGTIHNSLLLIVVSALIGGLFVLVFLWLMQQLIKLAENNSFTYQDTLDKVGEAYTPIPGQKAGIGKVLISIKGSTHELEALTDGDRIESGTPVRVLRLESDRILIVEKI
ncbi:MAG: NfeD family protein [Chitinophagales bacterium]|nr:NfeD family protein [Chitinophagales bacterium]HAE13170.1 serine protease [Bacteroidota bacterium]MCB9019654.1 NfeD family protein [Chitinophagales bacterium]MCB9021122.1 NfeD family protein [Chitinophagales bacterium]HPE96497.1 serine protease [Chitinophagales bacterium]